MSDLDSHKQSIRDKDPEKLIEFIVELRAKRRNSVVAAAKRKAAPKATPKKVAGKVGKMSEAQLLDLLEQVQRKSEGAAS